MDNLYWQTIISQINDAKNSFSNACYAVKNYWEARTSREYTTHGERRLAIQRETEAWEAQRDYWRAKTKELNNG